MGSAAGSPALPPSPFWEQSDTVARFAAREPDVRLAGLARLYPDPPRVRVLDLGCAAGRNTVFLARRGFDVTALDSSRAMVAETTRRMAEVLGPEEAGKRVRLGNMDRLHAWSEASVDLAVALGVLHSAASGSEWDRALQELQRVLAPGGLVLVANFTPAFRFPDGALLPQDGEPHAFDGMPSGRSMLFHAEELDGEFLRRGFRPLHACSTAVHETEGGRRVTANGLYLRLGRPRARNSAGAEPHRVD